MFETAEVGHRIDKKAFAEAEAELRAQLLQVQRLLPGAGFQTIVIVAGVEAAGKSEVVNRLHEWLDARGLTTAAFWDESDEERERPRHWRFWRQMPPRGAIGILFGSWYTHPIVERAHGRMAQADLETELARIQALERMLADDGAVIVKLWFHLSKAAQDARLKAIAREGRRKLTPWEKAFSAMYDAFAEVSEGVLRHTDAGHAPWHVIESTDARYRDLKAGRVLLAALQQRLARQPVAPVQPGKPMEPLPAVAEPGGRITVLNRVDLSARLSRPAYAQRLQAAQKRLNALVWKARAQQRSVVVMFEGWDAAGKGGAIRRITQALDARLFRVIPVAAPSDEERAQHHLWRFWRHLPRAGYLTIYDRSWYGRVLVERVEGFAGADEWGRAYREINEFERQLTDHGTALAKFWLHISPEEQLRRFEERARIEHKRHKITEEDWRNRDKWPLYEAAVDEMVARCSTAHAPWTLVAAECKLHARVTVVETLADRLERVLDMAGASSAS